MNNKYFKYILITLIVFNGILYSQNFINSNSKLTKNQRKMITQAKALESSGLMEEAIITYSNILLEHPGLKQAFRSLKNIYIRNNNLDKLQKISQEYLVAHNNNQASKLEIFDVYLITNNNQWESIIKEFYNQKIINLSHMKKIFSILLSNDKKNIAAQWIEKIRNKSKKHSFYSLEMGMYLSLKLDFDNAIDEYLLYLEHSPNNIKIITQRIMLLTDYDISINIIKNKLEQAKTRESKIIFSKLEFKLKNYTESYNILKNIKNIDNYKINLIEDLIKVNEFNLAQKIISDLINSSTDTKIIDKSIYQLALLYQMQLTEGIDEFIITKDIYKNDLLNSPFITLKSDYSSLLFKAIDIYDSLRTHKKDYKSSFQLAEIKYKIQGDLEGSETIYENIYENFSSSEYKKKSLNAIMNINLSKGDIKNTIDKINSIYSKDDQINQILDIKKIQIYFYTMDRDSLIYYSQKALKNLKKNNPVYNDILDILSLFHLYTDQNLENYTRAKFKIIQNKRTQAIEILNTIKEDNPLYNLAQFESIYLQTNQQNYEDALKQIQNIKKDTTDYNEQLMILEAEIYDYGLNLKSEAVNIYLDFLEFFPKSIFYDLIRIRLRELAL